MWLCLTWLFFFFGAVFASDSGTPEALRASAWMFYGGFSLGLAPLVTVTVLTIRRRLNPPVGVEAEQRPPINWRLYGTLGLTLLVLLGLNWLTAR